MATFGPKPRSSPFGKIFNFSTFSTCSFYIQERRCFVQEHQKTHFLGLYCPKKKQEKWPFLDLNQGLSLLEKSQFFDFLNFLFFCQRFFVLEYDKTHFLGPYWQRKKSWKNRQFQTKTMDYPLWKTSIFCLIKPSFFTAQKIGFSFQNIIKHIFLAFIA